MEHLILSPGSTSLLAICLAGWLLLVNSMTIAAFRIDRRRAISGQWRVSRQTLLMLAALGGWPGAKLVQAMCQRKLHRRPFRRLIDLSILPLLGLGFYLAIQPPAPPDAALPALQPERTSAAPDLVPGPQIPNLTRVSAVSDTTPAR